MPSQPLPALTKSQRRSQPKAPFLPQIKIPPDEGVRHHGRLHAAVSSPTAVSVCCKLQQLHLCALPASRSQGCSSAGCSPRHPAQFSAFALCTWSACHVLGATHPACYFILVSLAACSFEDTAFFLLCITCLGTAARAQRAQCLVTQHTKSPSFTEIVPRCIDTGCKLCTTKLAAGNDLKFVYFIALRLVARKDQAS